MSENEFSKNTSLTSKYEALEGQKQVEPSKQVHKQVRARFRHIESLVSWNKSRSHELPTHTEVCRLLNDAQTGMLPGYPESAICVQRFDDSLNSAIHTTYRNWLRSSSMHEPRDPPLEVFSCFCFFVNQWFTNMEFICVVENKCECVWRWGS